MPNVRDSFNPTMVRLLLSFPNLKPSKLVAFQSHNGAIAAFDFDLLCFDA